MKNKRKFTVVSQDDTNQTPIVDHVEAKDADAAAVEVATARADQDVGIVAVFNGHLQDQLGADHVQWTSSVVEALAD